ncbi:hypothetical protein Pst134EA_013432 [Puccinia striiformis f. sp. tritici]|nr:hypothetical protein Pst134EA_013432 [Puccinia striiformis f. sp. tritici]KAH9465551.1 hypothetical protein Pst134EA_013432 [Puccinia striiformis f. sp. tritici]KAI9603810.1 hypothetical protein H4Q26_003413 [Puccinia striiformis f. sp. tritici PST-130]
MIFVNHISLSIILLFINLQDGTNSFKFGTNPRPHSLHSRQGMMGGMGGKGAGGAGAKEGGGLAAKMGGGGAGAGADSGGCKTYMMMGARGTTEAQGSSMAYTKMAKSVLAAVPGGGLMDIQYSSSAEYMKSPADGAKTGLTYLKSQAAKCPKMVFVLMGYSKGAMVQSQILAAKDLPAGKVVATVLFGNPYFAAGAAQNKCEAKTGKGIAAMMKVNVPKEHVPHIYDCCLNGDMICQGSGGMTAHLKYSGKSATDAQAFIVGKLKGGYSSGGGNGGAGQLSTPTADTGADAGAKGMMGGKGGGMGGKGGGGMGAMMGGKGGKGGDDAAGGLGGKGGGGMAAMMGGKGMGGKGGGDDAAGGLAGKMAGKLGGLGMRSLY